MITKWLNEGLQLGILQGYQKNCYTEKLGLKLLKLFLIFMLEFFFYVNEV